MKFVFLAGGVAGFALAGGTGLYSGHSAERILLDGAAGCLVGSWLFRWFWLVCLRGFHETYIANQRTPAPVPAPVPAAATAKPAKN
ncbi:MAG TPA: hypothetical protein VHV47_12080 [Opitutaceae bacterium]|jgi:hypothetical protein|nr:hypothetical protein [Opitutaceae bacterium]